MPSSGSENRLGEHQHVEPARSGRPLGRHRGVDRLCWSAAAAGAGSALRGRAAQRYRAWLRPLRPAPRAVAPRPRSRGQRGRECRCRAARSRTARRGVRGSPRAPRCPAAGDGSAAPRVRARPPPPCPRARSRRRRRRRRAPRGRRGPSRSDGARRRSWPAIRLPRPSAPRCSRGHQSSITRDRHHDCPSRRSLAAARDAFARISRAVPSRSAYITKMGLTFVRVARSRERRSAFGPVIVRS